MAVTKKKASSSSYTYLGTSSDGTNYTKLVDIKDYPNLGGDPDMLDASDLSGNTQKNINGQQKLDALKFTANYNLVDFKALKAIENAGEIKHFCVSFGKTGEEGIFIWDGELVVYKNGEGVNAVKEMTISISNVSDEIALGGEGVNFTVGA